MHLGRGAQLHSGLRPALALDGEKKRCEVRSSNAGQVLFTGIALPERAARVADVLLRGIRTVAASRARFNPMSYHNGSVWPHDNALIALGLARYGLTAHVERLFCGLFCRRMHGFTTAAGAFLRLFTRTG